MSKKVIFIRSNPVSPDTRVEKEALALVEENLEVDILGWDREGNHQRIEHRNRYTINRFRLRSSYGSLKLFFYIPLWWIYEFYYLIIKKWDIVHSCDFDTLLPALIATKIKNKKMVYDIFDFYGDMISGVAPPAIIRLISYLERCLLRFIDAVIIADDSRIKQIENARFKRIVTIINTPPDLKNEIKPLNFGKLDKFLIFYGGIFGEDRSLSEMIKIVDKIENTQLVIAGYGTELKKITELCNKSNNSKFIGKLPYGDILAWTQKADMLFALYDPKIKNNIFSSPNKLFEAMMLSKPIIVSDKTNMAEIVRKENCGLIVDYENHEEIKNAIIKLKENPELREQLGKNGRNAYDRAYSWDIMKERLLKLYNSLG